MSRKRLAVCLLSLAGSVLLAERSLAARNHSSQVLNQGHVQSHASRSARGYAGAALSIPMTFEPNVGEEAPAVEFIGRGRGMTVLLAQREIELRVTGASKPIRLGLVNGSDFNWRAEQRLPAESNYFVGSDPRHWHTHVPHFARVQARNAAAGAGMVVYGNGDGLEYDLRLAPGCDVSKLRLKIIGADGVRLTDEGDLLLRTGKNEIQMRRPAIYEMIGAARTSRHPVDGGYVLGADGTVGFRIGRHDSNTSIVVDPTLSVAYATFLGGTGADTATSVAVDSTGDVYVGGATTSASTFGEESSTLGPGGGATEFFVAKINPATSGAVSLLYLTFIGGSGTQSGGNIALDNANNVAILGTTTSADFPVTDSSGRTTGANDITVSEIDPTGSKLVFSTLFGGSGAESENSTGAIAVDSTRRVYIASDTTSQDLSVTPQSFQPAWDGEPGDAFFAIFAPPASPGGAATLQYCSYLGTNSNVTPTVGGIAVDGSGNAYIVGSTANGANGFPTKNALQTAYGGGDSDAFLMKISLGGQGGIDLAYSTLLGGSGADQAQAVAVDAATPPNAYVTGSTQSADFPVNGTVPGFQTSLLASATGNAFFAVVNQNGETAMTSLAYSTFLGGSEGDVGSGIAVAAGNEVYLTGTTASWDFPWHDNVQPFNGASDAFVARFDPTQSGNASLIYATPLGGTSPAGGAATAAGNGIASDGKGNVFVAGAATAADFPTALTTAGGLNGFQPNCASCQQTPAASDAFLVEISESAAPSPSVYFNIPRVSFSLSLIGTQNAAQPVAVLNGGDPGTTLTITDIEITPNDGDFSLIGQSTCIGKQINPQQPGSSPQCSFEVGFTPSIAGTETAAISVTDNAPGSPQLLEVYGSAAGLVPVPTSLVFPDQPQGTTSAAQSVTLANTSNLPLVIDAGPTLGNSTATAFQPAGLNDCPTAGGSGANEATIAAGSSCTISLTFTPQSPGPASGEVDLTYNLQGGSQIKLVIPLSGTGTAPAPIVAITPASLDLEFGTIAVGATTGSQTVELQNQGSAALNLTASH